MASRSPHMPQLSMIAGFASFAEHDCETPSMSCNFRSHEQALFDQLFWQAGFRNVVDESRQ